MRIVAGEFRSRRLVAPAGMATRPTADRLRETLFNILTPRLLGCRFLDLYAGSGANGLEALSRGAELAVLVERAPAALAALRSNIAALGVESRAVVADVPVARWLDQGVSTVGFDVIFVDPPYAAAEQYRCTLGSLGEAAARWLRPNGVVVAEHGGAATGVRSARAGSRAEHAAQGLAESYGELRRVRELRQGSGALSFYTVATGA